MKTERLDKFLSRELGISRTQAKEAVRNAQVCLEGCLVKNADMKVDPENQKIEFQGVCVKYQEFVYLQMNKPMGILSATEDKSQPTCIDLIPEKYKKRGLFPVGRLDKNTEGLLLLTDDGNLAHRLLSPKNKVKKKYFAKVMGTLTEGDVLKFKEGVILEDGYKTLPAILSEISTNIEQEQTMSTAKIEIIEGKFHQIKRMFLSVGKQVVYLKRQQMGNLMLDPSLGLGSWRELTALELKSLRQMKAEIEGRD